MRLCLNGIMTGRGGGAVLVTGLCVAAEQFAPVSETLLKSALLLGRSWGINSLEGCGC